MDDLTPNEVDFLTLEDVFVLVEQLLGTRHQVRDAGLIDAAVARPRAVLFGADVYPGPSGKAAALVHSLVRNMPWLTATSVSDSRRRCCSMVSTTVSSWRRTTSSSR